MSPLQPLSFTITRLLCRAMVPSVLVPVTILLAACGGAGSSRSHTPPDGQVERDADFSGRWAVRYAVGQNDCGFPAEEIHTFVDIRQSLGAVTFLSMQGVELMRGEIHGKQSMAHFDADIQLPARWVRYAQTTELQIDDNGFTGREVFGLEDSAGNVTCEGEMLWQGSRTILRSTTQDPIASVADLEPNNTVVSAATLLTDTAVTGTVSVGADQVDIYTVPLSSPGLHAILLSGFAGADLNLALIDRHHNLLATSENGVGLDEYLDFTVDHANGGALYVIVSAVDTGETPQQEYLLQLRMQ